MSLCMPISVSNRTAKIERQFAFEETGDAKMFRLSPHAFCRRRLGLYAMAHACRSIRAHRHQPLRARSLTPWGFALR
jgi:hypothetical protein